MKFGGEVTRGVLNRYLKIPHFSRLGFFSTAILKMAADAFQAKKRYSVRMVVETCMIAQMKGIDAQNTVPVQNQ